MGMKCLAQGHNTAPRVRKQGLVNANDIKIRKYDTFLFSDKDFLQFPECMFFYLSIAQSKLSGDKEKFAYSG